MKISKEVKERLTNEIRESLLGKMHESRLDQDESLDRRIDKVRKSVIVEASRVAKESSESLIPVISKQVLDQIKIPENGARGESGLRGKEGPPGKHGKDSPPTTAQEKEEIAGMVNVSALIRDRKLDIADLIRDIRLGKIKPPTAGVDVKELIAEINKMLGGDDWQTGGGSAESVDDPAYTVQPDDTLIHSIHSLTGISTITLSGADGQRVEIKDGGGNARTNNITIDTDAGTIDGRASDTISSNYGFRRYYKYDGNWFISQEFGFTF